MARLLLLLTASPASAALSLMLLAPRDSSGMAENHDASGCGIEYTRTEWSALAAHSSVDAADLVPSVRCPISRSTCTGDSTPRDHPSSLPSRSDQNMNTSASEARRSIIMLALPVVMT